MIGGNKSGGNNAIESGYENDSAPSKLSVSEPSGDIDDEIPF